MTKATVADWDTTAADNEDINDISLAENIMRPPAVNNSFREMMKQIADLFGTAVTFSSGQKTQFQQNFDLEPGVDIPTYALTPTKLDVRRNRLVNHDKLVSQENTQTAGTTNGRYISDQNAMHFVSSAGTFTGVNVAGRTSPAGGNRDRITITTPDASLAAGEYLTYTQNLEASNIADLKWGAAGAVNIVVRRGFKFPAGTWPVAFHNSAANRSYVTTFTVSALEANTDIVREFSIPGDTTGTWLTADGVIGITMDVVIGAGSTFQGSAGWQPGNILTVSGATNGMALSGAIFEFFDEGLKADPDATGVYGQYEVGEVHPVYRSERYYDKSYETDVAPGTATTTGIRKAGDYISGVGTLPGEILFTIRMAKTPTVSLWDGNGGSNLSSYVDQAAGTTFTHGDGLRTAPFAISKKAFSIKCSITANRSSYVHYAANARLS